MKFTAQEDIEAPLRDVFRMACDFDTLERSAMHRGIDVQRQFDATEPAIGQEWDVALPVRDSQLSLRVCLTEFEKDRGLALFARSEMFDANLTVDLLALSRSRTRGTVVLDLQAKTLAARLLLQSLKFTGPGLRQRFSNRIADLAKEIEARYRNAA